MLHLLLLFLHNQLALPQLLTLHGHLTQLAKLLLHCSHAPLQLCKLSRVAWRLFCLPVLLLGHKHFPRICTRYRSQLLSLQCLLCRLFQFGNPHVFELLCNQRCRCVGRLPDLGLCVNDLGRHLLQEDGRLPGGRLTPEGRKLLSHNLNPALELGQLVSRGLPRLFGEPAEISKLGLQEGLCCVDRGLPGLRCLLRHKDGLRGLLAPQLNALQEGALRLTRLPQRSLGGLRPVEALAQQLLQLQLLQAAPELHAEGLNLGLGLGPTLPHLREVLLQRPLGSCDLLVQELHDTGERGRRGREGGLGRPDVVL
mmetsp:Transcript_8731/g.25609  ORF Transcript_8731/g.25609 Transcript_8731/m.25609 type:complete len:311 (+) Transcript_8731:2584-3516(+)